MILLSLGLVSLTGARDTLDASEPEDSTPSVPAVHAQPTDAIERSPFLDPTPEPKEPDATTELDDDAARAARHVQRGRELHAMGRIPEAETEMRRALALEPHNQPQTTF